MALSNIRTLSLWPKLHSNRPVGLQYSFRQSVQSLSGKSASNLLIMAALITGERAMAPSIYMKEPVTVAVGPITAVNGPINRAKCH